MSDPIVASGAAEAVILVKAAPVIGRNHGETVCCAGIDIYGNWLRMFPVSFRVLDDAKKFKRWDRVKFKWRRPTTDDRIESRHVDSQTLEIVGSMPKGERAKFLTNKIVLGLNAERSSGRSFALLKPEIRSFKIKKRTQANIDNEQAHINAFHAQTDLFIPRPAVPQQACPYEFVYQYVTVDGEREGTCQDWETSATFFNWRRLYGEEKALTEMTSVFGQDMPQRGLYFAMGTHSRWPDIWLINGLIQLNESGKASLF